MEIKDLYTENAYSFNDFYVSFDEYKGATTIILGKNKDQKTANGSGKSSILKMIFWTYYNKELNDEPLDDMINRNGSNGLLSILNFTDRGHSYRITRYRNYKGKESDQRTLFDGSKISGTGVEFLINGQPFHGSTHAETQKIIELKIRVSPKLFLSAVLMAQDSDVNFLKANDTDKKELLSELLDLQAYAKAFENIKKDIKEYEDKIANHETKLENYILNKDKYEGEIKNLKEEEENFSKSYATDMINFDNELKQIVQNLIALESIKNEKTNLDQLNSDLTTKNELIEKLKKENLKEKTAIETKAKSELDKKTSDDFLLNFEKVKNDYHDKIKEFNTQIVVQESAESLDKSIIDLSNKIKNIKDSNIKVLINNSLTTEKEYLEKRSPDFKKVISDFELKVNKLIQNENNDIKNISKENEKIIHLVDDLKNGNVCPTCKKEYKPGENDSIENLIKENEKIIIINKEKIIKLENDLENNEKELLKIPSLNEDFESNEEKIKELEDKLKKLNESKSLFTIISNQNKFYQKEITSINAQLQTHISDKEQHIEIVTKLTQRLKNISDFFKIVERNKTEISKTENEIIKINEEITKESIKAEKIKNAEDDIKKIRENEQKVKKSKEDAIKKGNPFTDALNRNQKYIDAIIINIRESKESILNLQEEIKYLNFWKLGFAPTGIRSFITDDVIELLNRKTQENLNDLFDGALTIIFDPESKNDKGIVSNKISTTYLLNGKKTPFGMLSGGEQSRAVLATNLALTEVAEARAGTRFNIRFLDEPFNGIDGSGQIKSFTLFNRLSKDKDGFFLISHDETFQNNCQNALYVIKEKEISHISDKSEFDSINIESDEDGSIDIDMTPKGIKSKVEQILENKKNRKQDNDDEY